MLQKTAFAPAGIAVFFVRNRQLLRVVAQIAPHSKRFLKKIYKISLQRRIFARLI
jgi:hypothetical protein